MLMGPPDILLEIVKHPNFVASTNSLRLACEYGELEVVRHLLNDPQVDPSECDNEIFIQSW